GGRCGGGSGLWWFDLLRYGLFGFLGLFGFEFFEGGFGAVVGAAGGVEAVLEAGESAVAILEALADGELFVASRGIDLFGGIDRELGVADAQAVQDPFAEDDFVEQGTGFR